MGKKIAMGLSGVIFIWLVFGASLNLSSVADKLPNGPWELPFILASYIPIIPSLWLAGLVAPNACGWMSIDLYNCNITIIIMVVGWSALFAVLPFFVYRLTSRGRNK